MAIKKNGSTGSNDKAYRILEDRDFSSIRCNSTRRIEIDPHQIRNPDLGGKSGLDKMVKTFQKLFSERELCVPDIRYFGRGVLFTFKKPDYVVERKKISAVPTTLRVSITGDNGTTRTELFANGDWDYFPTLKRVLDDYLKLAT